MYGIYKVVGMDYDLWDMRGYDVINEITIILIANSEEEAIQKVKENPEFKRETYTSTRVGDLLP